MSAESDGDTTQSDPIPLLCGQCENPVWVDESADEDDDLHVCSCPAEDREDGWTILTKEEMIDSASRWL